jgi:hypothetical protein
MARTMPSAKLMADTADRKGVPQAAEMRKVSLGEALKKRPSRAATRLIGVVPNVATLAHDRPGAAPTGLHPLRILASRMSSFTEEQLRRAYRCKSFSGAVHGLRNQAQRCKGSSLTRR